MVLTLEGGVVRTVFVEVPGEIADSRAGVGHGGAQRAPRRPHARQTFAHSLAARLRDVGTDRERVASCSISFVQEGEQLFDAALPMRATVRSCSARRRCSRNSRSFPAPTDCVGSSRSPRTPQALGEAIRKRAQAPGISITIGAEHDDPSLEDFTVVTAEYHVGSLAGVIGVIGPTRMPYDKVISLVSHTSQLAERSAGLS